MSKYRTFDVYRTCFALNAQYTSRYKHARICMLTMNKRLDVCTIMWFQKNTGIDYQSGKLMFFSFDTDVSNSTIVRYQALDLTVELLRHERNRSYACRFRVFYRKEVLRIASEATIIRAYFSVFHQAGRKRPCFCSFCFREFVLRKNASMYLGSWRLCGM